MTAATKTAGKTSNEARGLTIERRFTTAGQDPYDSVEWSRRTSRISNPDGSVVFEMEDAEIPTAWSQVAADIMVSKYFRKAGVPQIDGDGNPLLDEDGEPVLGPERSARQVIARLASTWRWWGETNGYFATPADADAFEDELAYMLLHQMAAPNSPQWFNTGLNHAYGITGPAQGFWYVDPDTEELTASPDSYTRPAPHACFIQAVGDDLVNDGGIMDLWVREARLFKFGSGTGTNFSHIRAEGESLSGGGKSSGLMSFLKVGDRAAGAIKSGGTTRRAAKMVILDVDHPDIEAFVNWKANEEDKVRALVAAGYDSDFNGEAYATVSGQNSNNSVRLSNEFIQAVLDDADWDLTARTDGRVMKTIKARDLWRQVAEAAWKCADPGVQFDTTIQEWHTSPAGGRIRATNPCFTGDTRIATDKGLIPIGDLVRRAGEGETFEVYSHDATNAAAPTETIRLSSPTHYMVTGTSEIVKLELSDGRTIRCTPNHRLFTHNRGWVRADELADDDRIRLLDREVDFGMASWALPVPTEAHEYLTWSSRTHPVRLPEKWSEDLAHYLGWLVGDGSVSEKTAVTVYGTEYEQQSIMVQHAELLTELNGGVAPKPCRMQNGTYQLRVTRKAIVRFFEALGVSREKAAGERVPWSIFEAPKPIVAAFLRGLYDADGCLRWGDTTRYVGLGSASRQLLEDVQLLLDTFGIHGSIYGGYTPKNRSFEYTTVGGEHRSYHGAQVFDVRIMGHALERFASEIGFLLAPKDDILVQMLRETTRYRTRDWVKLRNRVEAGFETTFNLSEPVNHSYLANNVFVANCSEYVFLDNTACNLASLNLVAFERADGTFDLDAYRHAIRLWTMVLEISVTMAHFPSREIAQGSFDYRTLGLGYANLGSLLMRAGIAYDSDEARAISGALTAVLTGYAYATSAEMAEALGPFPKYADNRDAMLRVMRNHRRAAYGVDQGEYDGVSHHVVGIDQALCPSDMLEEAHTAWDLAVALGEAHGYRNAQSTVLAPTGTIGLLMDCDTTGVEPDFALVKFKKLAGGGYFKIANQSLAPALHRLGYDHHQVDQIIDYVIGTMSLHRAPHVNTATLIAKGLTAEDIDKVETVLPGVFELGFAFNQWTLGEETMRRLGFTSEQYNAPAFNMLRALGYSDADIREANDYICGRQTIEGAPHLRDEHLPVFDTANKNGRMGERFIHYAGHIKMMAAAQPFISGAISKTTNVPNEITVDEIEEIYRMSWDLGLKAMALYRDGSKASQPLSAKSDEGIAEDEDEGLEDALATERELVTTGSMTIHAGMFRPGISPSEAYRDLPRPRFLLPARRDGYTQEARVGGHKLFMRTGEYDDGSLGELFLDLAKEGATLRGILSCFAIAVSKGLQYGVPLEEFVDTFTFQTFEPRGMVEGHPNIKMANSIVDYVFRALGVEYLQRDELAQVPPDRSGALPEPPKGMAIEAGVQLGLEEAAMEGDIDAQIEAARFVDGEDDEAATPAAIIGEAPPAMPARITTPADVQTAAIQQVLADKMGDAPLCDTCGHITVRNGSCYRCLNCGDSKGCS
jgi:ribonucleoside-diphosphate reductase alpha chain